MLPRMRAKAREREARKELEGRRERVATEHREEASTRATAGAVHGASSSIRGVTSAEGRRSPVVSQSFCGVCRPA